MTVKSSERVREVFELVHGTQFPLTFFNTTAAYAAADCSRMLLVLSRGVVKNLLSQSESGRIFRMIAFRCFPAHL